MAWKDRYNRPGPGIPKDAPKKKGVRLFFDILFREFFELVKLNLLFLLFCIPVVTIPAALTAMSRITVKMVRDEPHFLWSDFWSTFKSEFVPAALGGWLLLVVLGTAGMGASFYAGAMASSSLMVAPLVVTLIIGATAVMSMFYFFPMRALVKLSLGLTLKNAVLLVYACLPWNLTALGLLVVCVAVLFMFILFLAPLVLLLACSLLNLMCTFAAYGGLEKYVIAES